ncbi:MAG: hypothetical protein PVG83_07700 [Acidimicrobiia bacterium]|jgi:hypothetical protein
MSRRTMGLGLIALGIVLIVSGVVVALSGSPEDELVAPQATSTSVAATSTTGATTTTSSVTTSTTVPQTTTTTLPPESVEEFVGLFAAALENGDQEFVMDRLHPDVVDGYTVEVCGAWVGSEIMALSGYQLTGEVTGPVDKSVTIAGQSTTIPDVYSAPISFEFRGQGFDSTADFALIDGVIHWLGSCE